jgi:hypothetical protein
MDGGTMPGLRSIDVRLVIDDTVDVRRLIDWLGRTADDSILGAALLVNDGFGHMLPSVNFRKVAIPEDRDTNRVVELIDNPNH